MKDVVGYEKLYGVTIYGDVYSYQSQKILSPSKSKNGYYMVVLYKDKVKTTVYAHRIVAQAYLPNPDNLQYVRHKDGNKSNNCVDNLEWSKHYKLK